jgi:hypothetical protein
MYKILKLKELKKPTLDINNQSIFSIDLNELVSYATSLSYNISFNPIKLHKENLEFTVDLDYKDIFISKNYVGYLDGEIILNTSDRSTNSSMTLLYLTEKSKLDRKIFITKSDEYLVNFINLFSTTRGYKNYNEVLQYLNSDIYTYKEEARYLVDIYNKIELDIFERKNVLIKNINDTEDISLFLKSYSLKWPN